MAGPRALPGGVGPPASHQPAFDRGLRAAPRASLRLHPGNQRRHGPRAGRSGIGRRRHDQGRPGWRRHLSRSRPVGRVSRCSPWAPDSTVGPSMSARSNRWSSTRWSPSGWRRPTWAGCPATRAYGWASTRTVTRAPGAAEDLRHRCPHLEGTNHPRLRAQRDHRSRHVRTHRALRHRRATGDLPACRGDRGRRWPKSSTR